MQHTIEGDAELPVLVLANSLAATPGMWQPLCDALGTGWRMVRFNYAGHGAPGCDGAAPDSMEGIARDLLAMLKAEGVERFSFVGLSLGGMLGLHLAATNPQRIERLVVANCRYYQTEPLKEQWTERIRAVRSGGMEAIATPTLERWLTESYRVSHPDRAAQIRAMICGTSPAGYVAAVAAVRDFDARPLLDRIRCPVLVISADQDLAAPAQHLESLATALRARHVSLARCAHLSCVEQAESFNQAVGTFLA